ncbi:MAG: hypothetical protein ACETWK_08815 [Candidatus Aminicenantaceae bacterium]
MMKIYKIKILFPLFAFILSLFLSCKSPHAPATEEVDPLTETLETENFIFHYVPGDYVRPEWQEAYHAWATSQLGVTCWKKIDYYKYRDRDHMRQQTGIGYTNAYAISYNLTIHTIWPIDNHECVHCYTYLIGRASAFFGEGIAVAFSTNPYNNDYTAYWWGEPVHYWAKKFKDEGTLLALDDILTSYNFGNYDSTITYPESGSFVRFMIDNYGIDKMISIFKTGSSEDILQEVKQKFKSIYGFSTEDAEEEWLIFLDNY